MANEISVSASLAVSKGGASVNSGAVAKSVDMAGDDMAQSTQDVGTSLEEVVIPTDIIGGSPALTNIGMILVKNLDAANFVELSYAGTDDATFEAARFAKIRPGLPCLFQPALMTGKTKIYGRANTAAVRIQVTVAEV